MSQVQPLRAKQNDVAASLRRALLDVRLVAIALQEVALHAGIGDLRARALHLEREVSATVLVCDRVLAELYEANSRPLEPGLKPSAKAYGGFR